MNFISKLHEKAQRQVSLKNPPLSQKQPFFEEVLWIWIFILKRQRRNKRSAATKEVSGVRERLGILLGYGEAETGGERRVRKEEKRRNDRLWRGGLETWMLKIKYGTVVRHCCFSFVVFISFGITRILISAL